MPWRLQKRFFQPGHSVSTPVLTDAQELEKKLEKKAKKVKRKPKKGKVNSPPPSVWRDVGTEDEVTKATLAGQLEAENGGDTAEEINEEEAEGMQAEVETDVEAEVIGEEGVEVEVEVEEEEGEKESAATAAAADEEISPEGRCEHVVEEGNQLLFQRYCHVYERGELEDLCSWCVIALLSCS